jgi:hypothetical protein
MSENELPEPWLRGTRLEIAAVQRAVVHALELAREDLQRWCGGLSDEQINARPGGLPPVAFHLRHIARSLDRLLTYAEGRDLDDEQLSGLEAESTPDAIRMIVLELERAISKVRTDSGIRRDSAGGGQKCWSRRLPTTVAGLLVHVATHSTPRGTGHHNRKIICQACRM